MFRIYFPSSPGVKGLQTTSYAAQPIWPELGQIRINQSHCVASEFYALQSRDACNIYFKPLKHTVAPIKCFVERIFNFI